MSVEQNTPFGRIVNRQACGHCSGTGQIIKEKCTTCHGSGKVRKRKKLMLKFQRVLIMVNKFVCLEKVKPA